MGSAFYQKQNKEDGRLLQMLQLDVAYCELFANQNLISSLWTVHVQIVVVNAHLATQPETGADYSTW